MKKKIFLLLLIALFLVTITASFAGCGFLKEITLNEAKENLESAGYTVTVTSGSEYARSEQNTYMLMSTELENYLYAVNGDDVIYMYFLTDVDTASRNYEFMQAPNGLLGGQNNKVVYFGTKKATKAAKV